MPAPLLAGLKILSILLLGFYPFLVWFGLAGNHHFVLGLFLVLVFLLRFSLLKGLSSELKTLASSGALLGLLLVLASLVLKKQALLLYYPLVINAVFFAAFSLSLLTSQSLVERLARIKEPDLPAEAVAYTRRVTLAWCVFFIVNGGLALVTILLKDLELWAFYNGFVSYLLIALMMGVEWIVRKKTRNKNTA